MTRNCIDARVDTRPYVITHWEEAGHDVTVRYNGHELKVGGVSEQDGYTYVYRDLDGQKEALGHVESTEVGSRWDECEVILQYLQQVRHDWMPDELRSRAMSALALYQRDLA